MDTIKAMVPVVFTAITQVQLAHYAVQNQAGEVLGYSDQVGRMDFDKDGRELEHPVVLPRYQVAGYDEE